MRHINGEFRFEIGFELSANSPMTLTYTMDTGALPWQPILGENCYKCHEVIKRPQYYLEFIYLSLFSYQLCRNLNHATK